MEVRQIFLLGVVLRQSTLSANYDCEYQEREWIGFYVLHDPECLLKRAAAGALGIDQSRPLQREVGVTAPLSSPRRRGRDQIADCRGRARSPALNKTQQRSELREVESLATRSSKPGFQVREVF